MLYTEHAFRHRGCQLGVTQENRANRMIFAQNLETSSCHSVAETGRVGRYFLWQTSSAGNQLESLFEEKKN